MVGNGIVGSRMFDRGPLVSLLTMNYIFALAIKFEIALVTGEWHVRVMYVYHMKIKLTQSHSFGVT